MCTNIGKNYDDYFSFTIIRNPWEKVISLYFYDKPDKNNKAFYEKDYDKTTAFHHSFNDWLNWAINNNKFNLFKIENFAFENGFQKVKKIFKMEDFSIAQLFHELYLYN